MEHTVRRREYRRLPALVYKCDRQVTDDVPNATDFAGWERAVLGGNEYDSLVVDDDKPELTYVVKLLTKHIGCHKR